jgi:predicted dehydrogenase/threonine dehydrogenase-like Zn-dependent dehydrogenase
LLKKGRALVVDVPLPHIDSDEILVRVHVSCLSIGTEYSGLRGSAVPLWKKVVAQPDKAFEAIKLANNIGLQRFRDLVEEKKEIEHITGYSVSGEIIALGSDVRDFQIGNRVACAGAQFAHHAEYIRVSRNLCVKIPNSVDYESASTVAIGAIALQGVRRAEPTIGETFVVIGLGILGQMTVQILRANGCQVIGIDLDKERIKKASSLGMEYGAHPNEIDNDTLFRLTDGHGADGVIITAAANQSDQIVSSAFKMCRKKGRVVLVGDVGLHLNRNDFYTKELDFRISTSYGPGRYDQRYEEHGMDYPIAYVRWTENRNMMEFLRLIARGQVQIYPLVQARYPIHEADEAYDSISGSEKPLLILLIYSSDTVVDELFSSVKDLKLRTLKVEGIINVALIGAGNFARSSHLPNIKALKNSFNLCAVVNKTGPSARLVGKQFGAEYISTDPQKVFDDPEINAVLIATRHNLHGSLALEALKSGKHVLVEKPLTISLKELNELKEFYSDATTEDLTNLASTPKPILLTGYNRRFSPYAIRLKELLTKRTGPFILNYRMNAGYIPLEHWVHGKEGGGRNIGEACHIYDLFIFLAEAEIISYSAHPIISSNSYYGSNDNFVATFSFSEGSVASLVYTSLGNNKVPKESAELFYDGKVAYLDDYKSLVIHGDEKHSLKTRIQDKGLMNELMLFASGINTGKFPIPLTQQFKVSEIAFAIEDMIWTS